MSLAQSISRLTWQRLKKEKFFPILIPNLCWVYNHMRIQYEKRYNNSIRLPQAPVILRFYHRLLNIYLIYLVLRFSLSPLIKYVSIELLELNLPIHCYLAGKFLFHEYFEELVAFMFAMLHLSWHTFTYYNSRPYLFNMFLFLLIDDQELEKNYKVLEESGSKSSNNMIEIDRFRLWTSKEFLNNNTTNNRQLYKTKQMDAIARAKTRVPSYSELDQWATCFGPLYTDKPKHSYNIRRSSTCCELLDDELSKDSPTTNIICYGLKPIPTRLRPNRTMEAKRLLEREYNRTLLTTTTVFIGLGIIVGPTLFYFNLDPERYIQRYPGCDPELEQRINNNEFISTYGTHRLLSFAMDIVENALIYTESCVLLLAVWSTVYLVNYDILLYWHHLNNKLNLLTLRAREHFHANNLVNSQLEIPLPSVQNLELEKAVYEFQIEYYDFFRQIQSNNVAISDLITLAFSGWLVFFVILGHYSYNYYEQYQSYSAGFMLSLIQLFHLGCITRGSLSLSETHTKCLKTSYTTLCALMAYDQNPENKLRFIQLINFCLLRTRSVYTIFGQLLPYTKATYLSIFSWSLSGFFIAESLIRR